MGAANIWNASSPLAVDTSLSLPEMSPRVIELCKDLFLVWSKLDDSRFSVETVSGGITNLLLKVSVKEESGNVESVTLRLYGPKTEYVIDCEREFHVLNFHRCKSRIQHLLRQFISLKFSKDSWMHLSRIHTQ